MPDHWGLPTPEEREQRGKVRVTGCVTPKPLKDTKELEEHGRDTGTASCPARRSPPSWA